MSNVKILNNVSGSVTYKNSSGTPQVPSSSDINMFEQNVTQNRQRNVEQDKQQHKLQNKTQHENEPKEEDKPVTQNKPTVEQPGSSTGNENIPKDPTIGDEGVGNTTPDDGVGDEVLGDELLGNEEVISNNDIKDDMKKDLLDNNPPKVKDKDYDKHSMLDIERQDTDTPITPMMLLSMISNKEDNIAAVTKTSETSILSQIDLTQLVQKIMASAPTANNPGEVLVTLGDVFPGTDISLKRNNEGTLLVNFFASGTAAYQQISNTQEALKRRLEVVEGKSVNIEVTDRQQRDERVTEVSADNTTDDPRSNN